MTASTRYQVFATISPGLEHLLLDEIRELMPGSRPKSTVGGAELYVEPPSLWRLAHLSRLAETLRIRVGRFKAYNFEELETGLKRLPWHAYFAHNQLPNVKVTCKKSALYHSGAVAQRVQKFFQAAQKTAPQSNSEREGPTLFVRINKDTAQISVDAVGGRLHKRGYRSHIGKAPLRETLAAACLRTVDLRPDAVVWDPFCGSGTLVFEAMAMATGTPAAGARVFAFERWPVHETDAYRSFLAELPAKTTPTECAGFASDVDAKEVDAARANAKTAGFLKHIQFSCGDFDDVEPGIPNNATIVTNLPYGLRTGGGKALADCYRRFGNMLRRRPDLRSVWVLSGNGQFQSASGRKWSSILRFSNQGINVSWLRLRT